MNPLPFPTTWEAKAPRALALMAKCHATVAQASAEQDLVQEACRLLVAWGDYPLVWVGSVDPGAPPRLKPVAQAGLPSSLGDRLPRLWAEGESPDDPVWAAWRRAQPVYCPDLQADPACASWAEIALALGLSSCLALPLGPSGHVWGVMIVYGATPAAFCDEERDLLSTLAACWAQGLELLRLKQELRRLKDSVDFNEKILESSPFAVLVFDEQGALTAVNQAACHLLGFSPEELMGKTWIQLLAPQDTGLAETWFQELLSRGEGVFESHQRRSDGLWFPAEHHARLINLEGQKAIVSIVVDISRRRQTEELLRECEARNRLLFDNPQVGVFRCRLSDGKMLDCNETLARMFGYDSKEVFLREFVPIEHYLEPDTHERLLEAIREGRIEKFEAGYFRRDGSLLWLRQSVHINLGHDCMEGVAADITDLHQAEESVRDLKEKYRGLVEQLLGRTVLLAAEHQQLKKELQRETLLSKCIVRNCDDGVVAFDQGLRVILWNPVMERVTGLPKKNVIKRSLMEVLPPLQDIHLKSPYLGSARTKKILHSERLQRLTDTGIEGFFNGHYAPLVREAGEVSGGVLVIQDHSEVRRMGESVQEHQRHLEGVMNLAPEGIVILDRELTIRKANVTLEKWMTSDQPLSGKTWDVIFNGNGKPVEMCPVKKTLVSGEPTQDLLPKATPTGELEGWWDVKTAPLKHHLTGETVGVIVRVVDHTGRLKEQEALRESHERFRLLVDYLPVAVGRLYTDGAAEFVEDHLERLLGYAGDEFGPGRRPWTDLILPEDQEAARRVFFRALATDGNYVRQYRVKTQDGRLLWLQESGRITCDLQGRAVHTDIVLQDITDRKQAEEMRPQLEAQLRHSQRMDAIGSLAGGIAHDFNNILGVMLGYTEMAIMSLKDNDGLKRRLQQVLKAGNRGKELVSQILSFSRPSPQERRAVRLSTIVREALNMLRATLPTTIDLRVKLEENQDATLADATQIQQVVINLCTNAAHAMRDKGGLLAVTLQAVTLNAHGADKIHGLSTGPYLKLSVRDTGPGMSRQVLEKVFDPFFTTKKPGEGTGLGLAVVHGIVKAHEGAITVKSEVGQGTEFQVYLPRAEMDLSAAGNEARPVEKGQERLLFVDDEEWLVEMWREILESLGFRVAATTSPLEALAWFRRAPEDFDLIITDQTMPQMTGLEIAQEILKHKPGFPIILCTGYSEAVTPEKARELGIREFIMKPLAISELTEAISRALGKSPPEL